MKSVNKNILVKVDLSQNEEIIIGGNSLRSGKNYNENFRERNPVIAEVIEGTEELQKGSFVVCNYNYFEEDSQHQMFDNLFSIPANEEIFAIVNSDGTLTPLYNNILVERVSVETKIELPEELKKPHQNRGIVSVGNNSWAKGQFVFWLKMADYEIVYTFNNVEKRAIKVHESEIVGFLKN